ncbi:MAG TPA: serine/threonine-protein kinase [Polyangiaceae bacterium]|nr:serine/threonine-protein kinase [Polyangiaceae bacterium]
MNFAEDAPGRLIAGRYDLVEELGRGGMAVVWKAVQRGPGRFARAVALKRILPSLRGSEDTMAMFAEEARVGAELRHPNIVAVLDYGLDEFKHPYLVSEYVDGLDLGAWIRSHTAAGIETPWELVTAIGIEILRGLASAHARRDAHGEPAEILHRDVTPGNILLDVSGVVKLGDFGLAKARDRERLTRPDVVKGKAAYLAPELVRGEPASTKSDLFAVGIMLWEALSGARLFLGETEIASALLVRDAQVPLLAVKRPGLPLQLVAAVHRALEREPARRFASALEMLETLRGLLRVLPRSTDAGALGPSFLAAKARLGPAGLGRT